MYPPKSGSFHLEFCTPNIYPIRLKLYHHFTMTYIFKLNRPNNMIKKQYAQYANKNPCMQKKKFIRR